MTSIKQKHVFAAIGMMLFFWMMYTQFFASKAELTFIDHYHFDKVMHFLGGVMIAGVAIHYRGMSSGATLMLLLLICVGWEVFEVLYIPDVRDFYAKFYQYWLYDTEGDIIAGIIGGLCYAVFRKVHIRSQENV